MAVKSVTFKIGADTSDFVKGLKQADKAIRSTESQSKELQKGLKLEFDESRFVQSQKLAQQALQQTEEKAKAIRSQLQYLEQTGGIETEGYNKLQTELVKTENKAVLLKNQLKEINQLKYDNAVKGLDNLSKGLTKAGNATKGLSIAAAAALAGIAKLGIDAVAVGDDVQTMADQYDLSAESIQKWNYIALQTDAPAEQLYKGITKVRDAIGTALVGETNTATDAMSALGLSFETLGNSDEAFYKVASALANVEDSTLQAYYANEIFGERVATELIPLLKQGSGALNELSAEFESVGYLSNEQVRNLADFDNELNKMKTQVSLAKTELGIAFLPVLQDFSDLIIEKIIPAVKTFTNWFSNLSKGTKETIIIILSLTAALSPLLLIGGKLIGGIKSLMGLLNLLSINPIIAIIGLVAVLLTTLYASNEKFRNSVNKLLKSLEPLLDISTQLVDSALKPLMNIFESLSVLLGDLAPFITDVLNVSLASIAVSLIPTMFVLETIFKLIQSVVTGFKDLITLNWGGFAANQEAIWSDWKSDDFASSSIDNLKKSITGFGTSSTADTTGVTTTASDVAVDTNSQGMIENTSSIDNSVSNNYITIEANDYMNADQLVDAVSKKLTLKLQARS